VGHVWVEATISNPFTGRKIVVKALVDTGAAYTVIPRRIFEELQLPLRGKRKVRTAKGFVELDECFGVIEIMGKSTETRMLVSDDLEFMLISVTTLELLGLEVDPITGKLKEGVAFLL